ncbi:hypothetical protein RI129_001095 [Pyrocoelia pectoralis]|uniref:DDE Tnp4 domain-containing protein n=1 Tax=Pyrocoelia pectoralis TaxID=417401 RepID=A0AAN7VSV7_9COLE
MEVEGTEENAVTQSTIESIPKAVEDKAIQVNVSTDFGSFDVSNIINSNFNLKVFTGSNTKCSIRNKILLTLMRIKLDVTFRTLAILFNVSRQSAQTYFHSTIQLLSLILKSVIRFPDKDEIRHNIPICFSNFKNTRIVLDCTEISIQASKCLNCRIRTYSYYKGKHTCKFLIGVAPSGLITYVSDAYGGRTSDKAIFNCQNLIAKLEPLDAIMVDKGFLIEQECADNLITLIRPPFLKKNQQLSKKEAERTAEIARARVHVERSIQRIKNFRVFKNTIPWSLLPEVENIFIVAVGLTNLDSPILARDKFL